MILMIQKTIVISGALLSGGGALFIFAIAVSIGATPSNRAEERVSVYPLQT
jgi:hypothetical protein